LDKCRIGRLKQRIDPHRAGEPLCWSFAGRLRAYSLDFHASNSSPPFSVQFQKMLADLLLNYAVVIISL
jgi:hypothetical protein